MQQLIEIIKKSFRFNEAHLEMILEDIPEEKMAISPGVGLENHPAWTVGHLCDAAGMVCKMLKAKSEFPDDWIELYRRKGPGDPRIPSNNRKMYPDTQEVFRMYVKHHDVAIMQLKEVSEEFLQQEIEWAFGTSFPTIIETVHFMAAWHECNHISQLSAWRRAMGMDPCLRPLVNKLKEA